jgi:hypothetical protein
MVEKPRVSGKIDVEPWITDGPYAGGTMAGFNAHAWVAWGDRLFVANYHENVDTGEYSMSINPELEPSDFPPDPNAFSEFPYLRGLPVVWEPVAKKLRAAYYIKYGSDEYDGPVPPMPLPPVAGRRSRRATLGDAVNARVNAGLKASGILKVPRKRGSTVEQAVDRAVGKSRLLGIGRR